MRTAKTIQVKNNTISDFQTGNLVKKTWNEVFLILHDFQEENKISNFLAKIKNKYKDLVEESDIYKAMNKYNLVDIFNELHENMYYVWNDRSQLELIEKFNISSFERLYQIVDTIWMTHMLYWNKIDMPVNKFSLLVQYIDCYHTEHLTQEDYLLIAQIIEYKNMSWLYSWISALNLSESIKKIDFWYDDTVNILMFVDKYIDKNIDKNWCLTPSDLKEIYENYYDTKNIRSKKHSFSKLKKLLKIFGYQFSH